TLMGLSAYSVPHSLQRRPTAVAVLMESLHTCVARVRRNLAAFGHCASSGRTLRVWNCSTPRRQERHGPVQVRVLIASTCRLKNDHEEGRGALCVLAFDARP